MINNDRIVPITAIDLISMYGLILKQSKDNSAVAALTNGGVEGDFTITTNNNWLANEPVKSVNITSSAATLFFVPAYDYVGFSINGVAATPTFSGLGLDHVDADGRTLYKAVLSSGTITITKVGF